MATKKKFDHALGDRVRLTTSGEVGEIVGRAHYTNANPSYLVRYMAGDNRQVEQWWSEDGLTAIL